ncbi:MAG: S-layer family protein [Snowella sp.]|nr:S-layer family protein [Snowella sp.]
MKTSFGKLSSIVLWFSVILYASSIRAQISSDGTLTHPSSVNSPDNLNFTITNGTPVGGNLFHSFRTFSIPTNGSAAFVFSPEISNVISRVTGNQRSFIDGSLATSGPANVFFLNPNGILFGPNASLNIAGSFLATTAQGIRFADGQIFSTSPSSQKPLLSMSVPVGLQFGNQANSIQVQQSNLLLPPGQTLGLVGGELLLNRSNISIFGGRVELGSVGANSEVSIQSNGQGYRLGYGNVENFQNIHLMNGAFVDVTDLSPLFGSEEIGSGSVQAFGREIKLTDGSSIASANLGEKVGQPITISATESIQLLGTGKLVTSQSGDVSSSGIGTITVGNGQGGDIELTTQRLMVKDGAGISTRSAIIPDFNPNPLGSSGNITIRASDSITLSGSSPAVGASALLALTQTPGQAGNINLITGTLTLLDGGKISAQTLASGQGGNLNIVASQGIILRGQGIDLFFDANGIPSFFSSPSTLIVTSQGSGQAGNLAIATPRLTVSDQAEIAASSLQTGNGGNITINANQIELQRGGKLLANSEAQGQAGNLTLWSDQVRLDNAAKITVSSSGTGNAGNLSIQAEDIVLDHQSQLIAETATGEGGNINLDLTGILRLRNNSLISATAGTAGGGGNGGNIEINSQFVVGFPPENSDIIANAFTGQGGNIQINALGIFGIEPRANTTPLSDITASSTFGQFGVISINRIDVDPQSSLLNLPMEVIDPRNLIVQACGQGGDFSRGTFYITGRGGLPPNPQQSLETHTGLTDLGYPNTNIKPPADSFPKNPQFTPPPSKSSTLKTKSIIEAQGWRKDPHGNIVLTAQAKAGKSNTSGLNSPTCHDLSSFPILSSTVFASRTPVAR